MAMLDFCQCLTCEYCDQARDKGSKWVARTRERRCLQHIRARNVGVDALCSGCSAAAAATVAAAAPAPTAPPTAQSRDGPPESDDELWQLLDGGPSEAF